MPEFNRLKVLALRHARNEQPDSPSAGAPTGATLGAPDSAAPAHAPGAPSPLVPLGALGKLRATLSHAGHALGARRVDFATAFYQHTKHGRKTGSTRFVPAGNPNRPDTAGAQASAAQSHAYAAQLVSEIVGSDVAGAAPGHAPSVAQRGTLQALIAATPIDTVTSPDALRIYVRQLFEHPSRGASHASVLARTAYDLATHSRLEPKTEAAAAMRGALLALALRQAGATDVASAQLALERIASLDFDAPHTHVSASDADRQAWHAVRLLARSTEGFGVLDALRTATGEPFKDDLHRSTFKTLLASADVLAPLPASMDKGVSHDGAPGAVASRMKLGAAPLTAGEPGPHALARRAFDAAATRLAHGRDALTADQKGALFAWQQSFTEDGRNTDLSKVRARLNKFTLRTIPRVSESRWRTLLPRLVRGKQGSPLSALRLGTQGATRKTAKQEQECYRQGLRDSLATLRQSPAMQPVAVLGHARPKHSLVELAALHVWLEQGGFAHERMDEQAIVAVAQRARQMCTELEQANGAPVRTLADLQKATARWAAMTPRQLAKTKPFRKVAKRAYTPERLALWGKVAQVPHDSPFWAKLDELRSLARPTGPALPAKRFSLAVMEELVGPLSSTLETERIEEVRALLKELVETLPSSARLRLADGGRQGFSTSGLNGMTHTHGIPISPRLNVRASRTRETVVEFSHGTHGFEMFVGRAKTLQRQAGAGVLVGYDVETALTHLRVGLATNVTVHSKELVEASGVTVRVPHRVKADGSGFDDKATRAHFWAVVEHFLDEATQPHGDGANGTFNRLAERCLDHPDISIGWTDMRAATSKRGVTVDATASAKLASFGPQSARDAKTGKTAKLFGISSGPSVGMGWEKSKQMGGSFERSGRHRIEQRYIGAGHLTQLRGGIAPGFSHSLDAQGRSSVGLLSLDALVATLGLGENGSTAKLTLSIENDKLNYRACTLEREELNARRYAKAVDGARAALVQTLVANSEAQTLGTANTSTALVDPAAAAGARIDEYVATVRHHPQFNHAYKYSFRLLRDPAASIDLLTALVQQTGNDPEVEAFVAARRERILANPRAWVPRKLSIRERNGATRSPGLSAGLSLNVRTSATGDHEFANLSVPFPVLESIDEQGG